MATCPTCRSQHPDDVRACPTDGSALVHDDAIAGLDAELSAGMAVGEYRIEGKLGEGGFGAVYRAIHPVIGKAAAIKVLNHQYSANPQMVSRFIAEARAVNQIRHKGIIDVFSFGKLDDGRQYYIMELLEGVTLDAYVHQRGRLPPEEALPILRQIGRALDAAHGAGIAHRDLKPENVFLAFDDEGLVSTKLLDFGIAKLLGDSAAGHKTRSGMLLGSPLYMSPEQCRGKSVDHRTDIYSFGVMAYEILTGRLPFEGDDVMEVLMKQVSADPPALSGLCPDLPPALDAPSMKMLSKEPADRPPTLGAAMEAMIAAAESAGIAVSPVAKRGTSVLPVASGGVRVITGDGHVSGVGATAVAETQQAPGLHGTGAPAAQTMLAGEAGEARRPSGGSRVAALVAVAALALGIGGALLYTGALSSKPGAAEASAPPPPAQEPAPPAPPAPPAASVEVAPAPEPTEVVITLKATPPDLEVLRDGKKIGQAPTVRLPKGEGEVSLTFTAKGYSPSTQKVSTAEDGELSVTLPRALAPAAKPSVTGIHKDLSY